MIILKIILVILGIFFCIAEEYVFGVILIVLGLAISSKKKQKSQPQQQNRCHVNRRQVEDRMRWLLTEMQMCQQRINQAESEANLDLKTDAFSGIISTASFLAKRKNIDEEYKLLNKLRAEYDKLSNL